MGIFDRFRERIVGKREVAPPEEIRAGVLGEYPPPSAPLEQPVLTPPVPAYYPEISPPELGPPELIPRKEIKREEIKGLEYELRDRLAIIEAQLTAIRSQTETINERLKSLELKLGIAARRGYY